MNHIAKFSFLLSFWVVSCDLSEVRAHDGDRSAKRALSNLHVRDGFQLKLIASEPLISDPITARLDERGRLWVVEMPDYPTGPRNGEPGGRIKILMDSDHDGEYDSATLFADRLLFPTGVQPYRDGAIVTLAGKISFFRDADGDGVSDSSVDWFRGFAEQNEQLRANHPTLGPDGMVYVANGLRGGKVEAVDSRFDSSIQVVDLRDKDFCFDPEGGSWGAVTGKSQFGLSIDDFGRRIGCSNRNPAMLAAIPLQAIDRDPLLAPRDGIHDVGLAAEKSRVVSRADAWTTSNLHSGQFSAACGVLAAGMRDEIGEWMIVCEPTAYLVQRQRVNPNGSVWRSDRESDEQEFLSSTDTWFRPVDATSGPGESVLIVDMARAVIEHPDFMPEELKSRPDQWDGDNLGRIWKIVPESDHSTAQAITKPQDAYRWLSSESPWQRQVASQTLLISNETSAAKLHDIVKSSDATPQGIARAAWILARRGWLQLDDLAALTTSSDARLRALAPRLSTAPKEAINIALRLAADPDPLVQRTVATVLGSSSTSAEEQVAAMLTVANHGDDPWTIRALGAMDESLLVSFIRRSINLDSLSESLREHLITRLAMSDSQLAISLVLERVRDRDDKPEVLEKRSREGLRLLDTWVFGTRRGRRSPSRVLQELAGETKDEALAELRRASSIAMNDRSSASDRTLALEIASATGQLPASIETLLQESSPPQLRVAVLPIALATKRDWTRNYLAQHLSGMSMGLRSAAVRACGRSIEDTLWLLSIIEEGSVSKTIIDPATAKRLREHPNEKVRSAANRMLKSNADRVAVLKRYAGAATELGNAQLGRKLFKEHCSACHRIDGDGTNVGPDISDTRTKTPEALLTSILDPNAAIDASFVQYNLLTLDGRLLDGLLVDETADSVTLQQKGGKRIAVAREDIDSIQAPGVSLMPEGFEQSLSVEAMSHLLAYLKNWRYLKTSIPGLSAPASN